MENKKTYTIRPKPEYARKIEKALDAKMKKEKRPTLNNTIEAVLLDYFKIS